MSINNFYSLSSKLLSSTVQVGSVGLKDFSPIDPDETYLYDENRLIVGDYSEISFPVIFKQEYGKKLRDILDTGWPSLYLISKRMYSVMCDNNLTGWKTFDIKVFDKNEKEISGYSGLSITGRCGAVSYDNCEVVEKRFVPRGPISKYYKGLYVGLDTWDGTDFFIPKNSRWIIVSKRAAEILEKGKFSNIELRNLIEIETPEYALPT